MKSLQPFIHSDDIVFCNSPRGPLFPLKERPSFILSKRAGFPFPHEMSIAALQDEPAAQNFALAQKERLCYNKYDFAPVAQQDRAFAS